MANILVVDDAAADRELAGHLLEAKDGWSIAFAEDGKRALAHLETHAVDLVVTDLQMPELDGLGLVVQVKEHYPLVPVIVITSKGSEEIAAQALETGAASYVAKKGLVRDLVDAVERILAASRERQDYTRLLSKLQAASFVLENDLELISSVVSFLTGILRDSGMFDESDCHRITTSLDEALTNAYYHGNLEVRSEVREHDARAYRALANQRRVRAPYQDRRIRVKVDLTSGDALFVIKDDGQGFDPGQIPDPTRPENLVLPAGRGVFLMNTFMDHVEYNDVGNEVTLTKRRQERAVGA